MTKICRIITDNRVGNLNPALALAEAITAEYPIKIEHIVVKNSWFLRILPAWFIYILSNHFWIKFFFKIEFNPNVIMTIGNGSASIVPCLALRAADRKCKKFSLFVQLQNPRIHHHYFDYVVAPLHDNLRGNNIIPIIGSLSRVKKLLEQTDFKLPPSFSNLSRPIIGVFIGGANGHYAFSELEARKCAEYLLTYRKQNNLSMIVTFSRRTSQRNEAIFRSLLNDDKKIMFLDSSLNNAYFMMLKQCDAAIVTCDSVNMISDTITAGLPTYLYELIGNGGKFLHFYKTLQEKNLLFTISDIYKHRIVGNFNEAHRVARILTSALVKNFDK